METLIIIGFIILSVLCVALWVSLIWAYFDMVNAIKKLASTHEEILQVIKENKGA